MKGFEMSANMTSFVEYPFLKSAFPVYYLNSITILDSLFENPRKLRDEKDVSYIIYPY